MAEAKTKPTLASVSDYVAGLQNDAQRADSQWLIARMREIVGAEPKLWGPTIIGFGSYHYVYASGHEGDSFLAGFAPRKRETVVYLNGQIPDQAALLEKLGKHRMGVGCLYLKALDGIDRTILIALIEKSVAALRAKYPAAL